MKRTKQDMKSYLNVYNGIKTYEVLNDKPSEESARWVKESTEVRGMEFAPKNSTSKSSVLPASIQKPT